MKNNILFVVNPISGGLDKKGLTDLVQMYSINIGVTVLVYETTGSNDTAHIREICLKENFERVIVAGGDGTIKMVVEALEDIDIVLGILPAGSANGLATDLNLPKTIEENMCIAFHNPYMKMDVITINEKYSLHLSDLGLNADLIKNYEENSLRGFWGYAAQAYTTLRESEDAFEATIIANETTIIVKAKMIVIANSQKYGTGVVINPMGVMNDGKFELVILKNLDLLVLGKILNGNIPIDSEDIVIVSTDKAVIKTNSPVSFQIDGEYCGKQTELDIGILKEHMKVAIP
ncbi:diacylglycerol/lipid kinase family protein [Flavobacterium sp. TMP13]|uniref:diacylglycerol/lipid kinase family protein n=1 Tax=unclassified Flavobacterium TaxID=196869 RepID=UPI00076BE1D1|nr:diacylglycerol kinase family protein [Flavobacterium sp. TAB 87]KVV14307.1 putative lipid kinase BmrU [Flavobacterium sp. TAB 87]